MTNNKNLLEFARLLRHHGAAYHMYMCENDKENSDKLLEIIADLESDLIDMYLEKEDK